MADSTEDKVERTLTDVLTEIINHLDLSPAHRADLLGAVESAVGNAGRPTAPPVASPGFKSATPPVPAA
jgi:hypothetical protein